MAKIHGLKPGDRVTLNTDIMARGLLAHCRSAGIVGAVGVVLVITGRRVHIEWPAQMFDGWFDADALTVEEMQPGLFVTSDGTGTAFTPREYTFDKPQTAKRGTSR